MMRSWTLAHLGGLSRESDCRRLHRRCLAAILLTAVGCTEAGEENSSGELALSWEESVQLEEEFPEVHLRWPRFLLATSDGGLLWGGRHQITELRSSGEKWQLSPRRDGSILVGLDSLVGAAEGPDGLLALLDSSGRVTLWDRSSGTSNRFATHLENDSRHLVLAAGAVYLLLEGEREVSNAVVGFSRDGREIGRWGSMPLDGAVQSALTGGGLTQCAGALYASYVNSPAPLVLTESHEELQEISRSSPHFERISSRRLRRALRESRESGDVRPLVEEGLSASRVMSLHCIRSDLLIRQVSRKGRGTTLELWSPRERRLLARHGPIDAVLMTVRGRDLFFLEPRDDDLIMKRAHIHGYY